MRNHDHDYKRNGTTTLFAALNILDAVAKPSRGERFKQTAAQQIAGKPSREDLQCCSFQTSNLRQKSCRTTTRNCGAARDAGLDRRRHQRRAAEPGRAVCVALAGFAAAGDARGGAGRHRAGGTPGAAPDQPQPARHRQQHAGREHPDRDAGRNRPRASSFRGGAAPDHRGQGRLHGRQRRARTDVARRSRADAQLVMARPRQRHRCADDLARRSGHAAGADARGGVL